MPKTTCSTLRMLLGLAFGLGLVIASNLAQAEAVDFVRDVRPILQKHCHSCHGTEKQKSGLRLDVKSEAFKGGDGYGPAIVAGNVQESPLLQLIEAGDEGSRMPPSGAPLSPAEIATLKTWIEEGAAWPDGVDLAKLEDRRDHWSFKPIKTPTLAAAATDAWSRNPIDRMILGRLDREGLKPAREASRATWLRRVSFDLIGLPPTPEQVAAFIKDGRPDAYERIVEGLLASPRYGERWAQHWLDVVRYADTHGFEVNTERPNAWPYRDYVIESFNSDTPYDRFIREQLVGDALGKDAATGFLITASVLLPGQIGADDVSKRLARQDAIDEIVVNIGQTFLGLSVGCARCHDHKFDPITARDYYSMQAFVAGVEYGDRELRTPESLARRQQVATLKTKVADLDRTLARYEPLAQPGRVQVKTPNPSLNDETFAPIEAKFVRFNIHDANLHPTLGLIEPCIDEFEVFSDEPSPRNVALAGNGGKVTASGSRTSDIHRLEHLNDGEFGNARSWMSDEPGRGVVTVELAEPTRIKRITWSRDRQAVFSDRLATAYTIEAGPSLDALAIIVDASPSRPAVNARINTDRFAPVASRRVRFTINATNRLEPCIDELEVFDASGRNVALASAGATVRSSGDTVVADRHDLRFINDGRYGNSHSWMSNEPGKGWVEIDLGTEQTIERVCWGRDRQAEYEDRLAIDYRIEVVAPDGAWRTVADSSDRRRFTSEKRESTAPTWSKAAPNGDDVRKVRAIEAERKALEVQIAAANREDLVFAGAFRKPDTIHLLNRGDPEQPKEEVAPALLSALGESKLTAETGEQERRRVLADWIASPENPLTARVMANRIWQGHFGTGLVETASDFGRMGTKPSHPDLLDWLAAEFIRTGWSIKQMHRLIVLSSTYRQSTRLQPEAAARDVDARLLWRYPSRRLDAETIRDSMLAVCGRLDQKMGGSGFDLFDKRGGLTGFTPVESFQGDGLRRMIYAHKVRRERDAVFGAFDCPDAGQSTARRRESTTPIQALNLFNSRFTLDQADAFAARVTRDAGGDVDRQVRRAYQLALTRDPSEAEAADARAVVSGFGAATLCRVLLNCNEFLFMP
jgi:mono/diheme cytochrome c family protein